MGHVSLWGKEYRRERKRKVESPEESKETIVALMEKAESRGLGVKVMRPLGYCKESGLCSG